MDILKIPVSDIKEFPVLDSANLKYFCDSLDVILSKCLYCVRQQLACPFEVLVYILMNTASDQMGRFSKVLLQGSESGSNLDQIYSIIGQILSTERRTMRLHFDIEMFFEFLQILCETETLKEKIGFRVGKIFVSYMTDTEQHKDDYRVHRSCASCLITLLRGSKVNKNKLAVCCSDVGSALQNSTDFFFQMQCAEILFRLYAHNNTVLMHAEMDARLRRGIMDLPNDSTILLSIQSFLDRFNSEAGSQILSFTVLRIEVDEVEVCSHTTMYFSDTLMVTLLPGGNGDNFTVPFEHIRSVKLSKDHKLGLRLIHIPAKLSSIMAADTAKDTLHVFLTQSMLQKIRTCGIHEWIAKRKQSAPLRVKQNHTAVKQEPENLEELKTTHSSIARSITERPTNVSGSSSFVPSRKTSQNRDGSELFDIHRAASIKATRHREEQLSDLQHISDSINQKIEDMKHLNARDRDTLETSFRQDITSIRVAEAELKESASSCVQTLNAELEDIQALGALLKTEVDKLREKIAKSSGRAEGVEEASLLRIKQLVDESIKEMEMSATAILIDSNPLHAVGEYIIQKSK